MFLPESFGSGLLLMIGTTLLWGAWPNTIKLSRNSRFEIYYWDYAFGVLLMSIIISCILGSCGRFTPSFFEGLLSTHLRHFMRAFLAGLLVNIAQLFLVAASALSGIGYAFFTAFGTTMVVDALVHFLMAPHEYHLILFIGIVVFFIALMLMMMAYKQGVEKSKVVKKAITMAFMAGMLFGLFYPLLGISISLPGLNRLGPYVANFIFSIGFFISAIAINPLMMWRPIIGHSLTAHSYFEVPRRNHFFGLLGGGLWSLGLSFRLIASQPLGLVWVYVFLHLGPLLATFAGIFYWKEFKKDAKTYRFLMIAILGYIIGLCLVGYSRLKAIYH